MPSALSLNTLPVGMQYQGRGGFSAPTVRSTVVLLRVSSCPLPTRRASRTAWGGTTAPNPGGPDWQEVVYKYPGSLSPRRELRLGLYTGS